MITLQTKNLISRVRTNKRAARVAGTSKQFCGVFCKQLLEITSFEVMMTTLKCAKLDTKIHKKKHFLFVIKN